LGAPVCCADKGVLMGCFCHATTGALTLALPSLNISASLALPGANVALGLQAYLNAAGLPAEPWVPDPAWLALPLPQLRLNAQAVATISAMASLRAQVLAQFGIDLLIPGQAMAMARIVATLNARLSAMAHINFNPLGWLQLAALNSAIDQVSLALSAGLLMPSASMMMALTVPGGIPMPRWTSLLALLRALCPMIAATAQLNLSLSATAELAAALRVLARLSLPALVAPELMMSLTAALSAVAQLQLSLGLGVSPLRLGFPAIQLRVQARLAALMTWLSARFGLSVTLPNLLALLLSLLPKLPVVPTSFATSAVIQASMQAHAMASLNWQVPPMIAAVHIGLPTCAFVAQLHAALGITAVLPSPCSSGCDAAKIVRALAAA
jgi:hypothetical protein